MFIQKRRIVAEDEIDMEPVDVIDDDMEVEEEVIVEPEAADLLFEAEDVAELIAEITEVPVEVTADETTVTFAVGEDEFIVEAEGDEEVLEAVSVKKRGVKAAAKKAVSKKAPVKSSRRPARKPVEASKKTKVARRVPRSK